MRAHCPNCKRWVDTYAVRNSRFITHRRFDMHTLGCDTDRECDMSDEPVPAPPHPGREEKL